MNAMWTSVKQIPGTSYTVDCFKYPTPNCTHYFLSHFHADHYNGLRKSFTGTIYCSETTANLVQVVIGVSRAQLVSFEMYKSYQLDSQNSVTCVDANHCPGAVCFVFSIGNKKYLHTGDFRASSSFYAQPFLDATFDRVFLDNTFENFRSFLPQREIIRRMVEIMIERQCRSTLFPHKYAFLFCSYLIGKEKCFLSVAEFFDRDVLVESRKKRIFSAYSRYTVERLNNEVLEIVRYVRGSFGEHTLREAGASAHPQLGTMKTPFDRIRSDRREDNLMVISMFHVNKDRLNKILRDVQCDRAIVFCGTGWKDQTVYYNLERKNRVVKKGIEVVYLPYSEHSSDDELAEFKRKVFYKSIVNTVKM